MTTILILDNNILQKDILIDALSVSYFNFDTLKENQLNDLTNIDRIGFIWNNNNCKAPFGKTPYKFINDTTKIEQRLFYFTFEFVELINYLYAQNNNLKIDLMSGCFNNSICQCDITYLKTIMPKLTVNYSINNNWVMESNQEDIKNIYFNQNIINFTEKLSSNILEQIGFIKNENTYVLNNDLIINNNLINNSPIFNLSFPIDISSLQIINGNNKKIIINLIDEFNGLFTGSHIDETILKNFNIIVNGNITNNCGALWTNLIFHKNWNVTIESSSAIVNGNILEQAGGLVGYGFGYLSKCIIDSSHVIILGNIMGTNSGGLIGSYSGSYIGSCSIITSYVIVLGNIVGNYSGGITGSNAGAYNGVCNINSSYVIVCGAILGINTYAISGFLDEENIIGNKIYCWILNNGINILNLQQSHLSLSDIDLYPVYKYQKNVPEKINQNNLSMTNIFYLNYRCENTMFNFIIPSLGRINVLYDVLNNLNNCIFYSGATLSDKDLSYANLTYSDLSDTSLNGCNINNCNFSDVIFNNTITGSLISALNVILPSNYNIVTNKSLSKSFIIGPNLNLKNIVFNGFIFSDINFTGCNLNKSKFIETEFQNIIIDDSTKLSSNYIYVVNKYNKKTIMGPNIIIKNFDLSGITIGKVNLTGLIFNNTNTGPLNIHLNTTVLHNNMTIIKNKFGEIFLVAPNLLFDNCDLSGSNLSGCNFCGCDLSKANIIDTIPGPIFNVSNIKLPQNYSTIINNKSNIYIVGPNLNLKNISFNGAILNNVNLIGCDLKGSTLIGTNVQNIYIDNTTTLPTNYNYITNKHNQNTIVGPNLIIENFDITETSFSNIDLTETFFFNSITGPLTVDLNTTKLNSNMTIINNNCENQILLAPNLSLYGCNLTNAKLLDAITMNIIPHVNYCVSYELNIDSTFISYGETAILRLMTNCDLNIEYQLYMSLTNSYNGIKVNGATDKIYNTENNLSAGIYYYYYVITYNNKVDETNNLNIYNGSFIYSSIVTLNVSKAVLKYFAMPKTNIYGSLTNDYQGNIIGFKNDDTIENSTNGALIWNTPATNMCCVGSYPIYGSGLFSQNYNFEQDESNNNALKIIKANLIYVAEEIVSVYGDIPIVTGDITGFKNNDNLENSTSGQIIWTTTANNMSDIGSYPIFGSGLISENYNFIQFDLNNIALTIIKSTLIYVANCVTNIYRSLTFDYQGNIYGFKNNDTIENSTTGQIVWITNATNNSNVGLYEIYGSGLVAKNYDFIQEKSNDYALTIGKATLIYLANNITNIYGSLTYSYTGTINGFKDDDTIENSTTGSIIWTTTATNTSDVGVWPIYGSGLISQNYEFVQSELNSYALIIDKATLIYLADNLTNIYGSLTFDYTGNIYGFKNDNTIENSTTGQIVWITNATNNSNVGLYEIYGSGLVAKNYDFIQEKSNDYALTINKATLIYVANNITNIYGSLTYDYTGIISGFKNDDTIENSTDGTLIWTTNATNTSDVGIWAIYGSGLTSNNYNFIQSELNIKALTIDKAILKYVANPVINIYGSLIYDYSGIIIGFKNLDTIENSVTGEMLWTTNATNTDPVGFYSIIGSGLSANNYAFIQDELNFTALTIDKASLIYLATPKTNIYGSLTNDYTGFVMGFKNFDTLENSTNGELMWVTNASNESIIGSYNIYGDGLTSKNYIFIQDELNNYALTIEKATLTYLADSITYFYGSIGVVSGTVTGFKNNDNLSNSTTGNLMWETPANDMSNVGLYPIIGVGLSSINYNFIQHELNYTALTIDRSILLYVANKITIHYGSPIDVFGTVIGFKNGDTIENSTSGTLKFSTNATNTSIVGNYFVIGFGLFAQNYNFAQHPKNMDALTICKANLIYIANKVTLTYGSIINNLSGTVCGFKNLDTIENSTTGLLTFSTMANNLSAVGNYSIYGSGLFSENYEFIQDESNLNALTINKAQLTYLATKMSCIYGSIPNILYGTVIGFKNIDNIENSVSGEILWTTTAKNIDCVGNYPIYGSGLISENYYFIQDESNLNALTVNKAFLSYNSINLEITYGSNPVISGTITGFKNTDNIANSTSGELIWTTNCTNTSNVGSYYIIGSGLIDKTGNYDFTQNEVNYNALKIVKATPSIISLPIASDITFGQTLLNSTLTEGVVMFNDIIINGTFIFINPLNVQLIIGIQNVEITFIPNDVFNFNVINANVTINIIKQTPKLKLPEATEIIYGQTLSNSMLINGMAYNNDNDIVNGNFSFENPTNVLNAGNQLVTIIFTPNDYINYNIVIDTIYIKINQRQLIISASKQYDGTTNLNQLITITNYYANESLNYVAYSYSPNVSDNNINYIASITLKDNESCLASNYCLPLLNNANAQVTIIPTQLSITGLSVENKMYDGNSNATIIGTPIINGIINNDEINLINGYASFSDSEIGSNKNVIFTNYFITGLSVLNYYLIQPLQVTADILPNN